MKDIVLSVKRSKFRTDDPKADEANNEFVNIRKSILERDDYTCQICKVRGSVKLHGHHIKSYKNHKKERLKLTSLSPSLIAS